MSRGFCPKCGLFAFGYDPIARIYRCYRTECGFRDEKRQYGKGLSDNPFTKYDAGNDSLTFAKNSLQAKIS